VASLNKTIVGFLLFCVLVDPVAGTLIWLHCKKTMVRKEVEKHIVAGVDKHDVVVLQFTKAETQTKLRWEHAREFEYNHQMYDVIETRTVGDRIYYRCLWDKEETRLNRRLEELAARSLGNGPKIREKQQRMLSAHRSLYRVAAYYRFLSTPELMVERLSLISNRYYSLAVQPPTPPPRFDNALLM
jgi:hypothetical protein